MTTELQNKVWSILPKEFKEEVKEIYSIAITYHPCGYNHKTDLLKYLFGYHNLTSDAEEEELLTCSNLACCRNGEGYLKKGQCDKIQCSNRSKCLTDEELKPTEPKENANKHLDNILKGSFNEHNRLHIAAMIISGLLVLDKEEYPVRRALDLADALIAKCEKGGDNA